MLYNHFTEELLGLQGVKITNVEQEKNLIIHLEMERKRHNCICCGNSRFFDSIEDVPKQAITMGMVSIMQAKKILLIANGKAKEEILKKAFSGPITPEIPASILQLHPDVTVIYSEE